MVTLSDAEAVAAVRGLPQGAKRSSCAFPCTPIQRAHRVGDRVRFHAHPHDLGEQGDHALLVICEAVGVELLADGGVLDRLLLVLIEHPVDRAAVTLVIGKL